MSVRTDPNLRLLFAALLLWMLGVALYDQLIPIYARQLGATPVQLGTLFTLRNLTTATGFLIGWTLADGGVTATDATGTGAVSLLHAVRAPSSASENEPNRSGLWPTRGSFQDGGAPGERLTQTDRADDRVNRHQPDGETLE